MQKRYIGTPRSFGEALSPHFNALMATSEPVTLEVFRQSASRTTTNIVLTSSGFVLELETCGQKVLSAIFGETKVVAGAAQTTRVHLSVTAGGIDLDQFSESAHVWFESMLQLQPDYVDNPRHGLAVVEVLNRWGECKTVLYPNAADRRSVAEDAEKVAA